MPSMSKGCQGAEEAIEDGFEGSWPLLRTLVKFSKFCRHREVARKVEILASVGPKKPVPHLER